MNLEFHPVDQARWKDFEQLFESKGGPHYCWCMVWRKSKKLESISDKSSKKAAIKDFTDNDIPIGILAYLDGEPIAWCSIAPRETHKKLSGDETKDGVWSLTCFFIKRAHRNQGLTYKLLQEAIKFARMNGAKYVEAYPVAPDSPSYRFMGIKPTFEKAEFEFVKKVGSRRNVMILELI
ncbi:GNAT family N-acetyltransferase [Fulvivirgaceae bacterium BMA10]|uniref:GNAT family N-acetyltransferase n=1 Tax=Splendidivirga corallicola TaxID=3051826 RepID=A0ABT8KKW6_9BACT|nr:GNAT family N-acetyltransferase [Fulvivirgaceae bacterium BMA10]